MERANGNPTGHERTKIHQVEELTPEVILAVADRVAVAMSFEDLIYRESELDALWSLADIAEQSARTAGTPDAPHWAELRERLGEVHDLLPEGEATRAADLLRATVALL